MADTVELTVQSVRLVGSEETHWHLDIAVEMTGIPEGAAMKDVVEMVAGRIFVPKPPSEQGDGRVADQVVACDSKTGKHRFGHVTVSEANAPAKCACGGVTADLVNGRAIYTMSTEALRLGGSIEFAEQTGRLASGYSINWGRRVV